MSRKRKLEEELVGGQTLNSEKSSSQNNLSESNILNDSRSEENNEPKPKKKPGKPKIFKFGNYDRYYGYRNLEGDEDKRLGLMKPEWFQEKDVLDIGCNVGAITLSIAKLYYPKKIVGVDIDRELIFKAKQNLKRSTEDDHSFFMKRVHFVQGNYVPDRDDYLANVTEEFDAIVALSITKWIHMNFGDSGLKRAFKKMFKQLRPGGILVLEPQQWSTYKKKSKLTKEISETYKTLKFLPRDFINFLSSDDVGFVDCESLGSSDNNSRGFQRPMYVLKKRCEPVTAS